jgi:hypothetical protein
MVVSSAERSAGNLVEKKAENWVDWMAVLKVVSKAANWVALMDVPLADERAASMDNCSVVN